jgi:hypothetical protein
MGEGKFIQTGVLNKPPTVLRSGVTELKGWHISEGITTYKYVSEMLELNTNMKQKFRYPGSQHDQLFEANYDHSGNGGGCENCVKKNLVTRKPRDTDHPVIHYGIIGSANQVMRHGATREKLRREKGILCFEMEAAGLMDNFPCLVIRGICDYSDTHKSKHWQPYAAATAAAYAKELLEIIPEDGDLSRSLIPVQTKGAVLSWFSELQLNLFLPRRERPREATRADQNPQL